MKYFDEPKMEVVHFVAEDIITTSGFSGDGDYGGSGSDD